MKLHQQVGKLKPAVGVKLGQDAFPCMLAS